MINSFLPRKISSEANLFRMCENETYSKDARDHKFSEFLRELVDDLEELSNSSRSTSPSSPRSCPPSFSLSPMNTTTSVSRTVPSTSSLDWGLRKEERNVPQIYPVIPEASKGFYKFHHSSASSFSNCPLPIDANKYCDSNAKGCNDGPVAPVQLLTDTQVPFPTPLPFGNTGSLQLDSKPMPARADSLSSVSISSNDTDHATLKDATNSTFDDDSVIAPPQVLELRKSATQDAVDGQGKKSPNTKNEIKGKRGRVPTQLTDKEEDITRNDACRSKKWCEKFEELRKYRRKYGHCHVPYSCKETASLFRWIKRQRYQYKLLKKSKPSSLSIERFNALKEIGFNWDPQSEQWEDRFSELVEFHQAHGHCNVPSRYPENQKLAVWVKVQRRQQKLLQSGQASNITLDRIKLLDKLNFTWIIRNR